MNIFKNFFDKVFGAFKSRKSNAEKAFDRKDAFGDGNAKVTTYNKGVIGRVSKSMQPSKNGNRLSSGTSGSKPLMAGGREEVADGSMGKDNSSMQEQRQFDERNSAVQVLPDGSMVDNNPQSWENTTRRPHRNGHPTESDLVSRIAYDAKNGTLSAETKRGSFNTVSDDGSGFAEFENAGSKGRHAVASGNQSF